MAAKKSGFLHNLRGDVRIYGDDGPFYQQLGFWVAATQRVGALGHTLPGPMRIATLAAHKALSAPWRFFRAVYIPGTAEIGPGLRMPHPQGIYIPPATRIGRDCSIYHEVTLGRGPLPGVPEIGDEVMIYAGARVLGGVKIGHGAVVGANAVVTKDVPAGAVVSAPASRAIPLETVAKMAGGNGRSPK